MSKAKHNQIIECDNWIDVEDQLPKEGQLVLTWRNGGYHIDYIKYFSHSALWMRKHKDEESYPTHWIPLPEPPTIE